MHIPSRVSCRWVWISSILALGANGPALGARDDTGIPDIPSLRLESAIEATGTESMEASAWKEDEVLQARADDLNPDQEVIVKDAVVRAMMALDAYSEGDLPTTRDELEAALDTLLPADLHRGWRSGLKLLSAHLPPGYEEYDLVKVYKESGKRQKAVEAVVEESDSDSGEEVGEPQGMRQEGVAAPEDNAGGDEVAAEKAREPKDTEAGLSKSDRAFISREVKRILAEFGETEYAHSEILEQQVAEFIELYQTSLAGFMNRSLLRAAKYLPMVQKTLGEKGVPKDMAFIAFVESGFRPNAVSRAGAVGLWQFMPRTARAYGLKVSHGVDERRDPRKATVAAREYFLDLVAIFGSRSFLLAMASYNAGEGKVQYCLKQVENPFTQRTFWDISPCLRKETREYIPRVIAAAIVVRDADRFGFDEAQQYLDPKKYQVTTVSTPTSLSLLAGLCDLTVNELRALNPDLAKKASTTPSGHSDYSLLIPAKKKKAVLAELELIAKRKKETVADASSTSSGKDRSSNGKGSSASKQTKGSSKDSGRSGSKRSGSSSSGRTKYIKYEVRKLNSLSVIAADFGTDVARLKQWNPYLEKRELWPGDVVHIYDLDWSYRKWSHKVQRGEALGVIARKYGVKIDKIQRWNGLEGVGIQAGKTLVIYTHGESTRVAERNFGKLGGAGSSGKPIVYVVQKGNNLSMIAASFGVDFRDIMRWNNLKSGKIYPGQKLTIYPGARVVQERYKVKRGDTIIGVARKFDMDPAYLAAVNGLNNKDHIESGQVLIVYRRVK